MTATHISTPIIIDCDTGRDDALTLWLALARGMDLAGVVTSYGNVGLGQVTENTARILHAAGAHKIPMFTGAQKPMRDHHAFEHIVRPRQDKSGNGLCNLDFPAHARAPIPALTADHIKALHARHGALHYVVLGPATNLAHLCDMVGPDIHAYISRTTIMGGKIDPLWSAMPGADFNLVCDPFAIDTVLAAGINPNFVTMNTTWDIWLDLPALE